MEITVRNTPTGTFSTNTVETLYGFQTWPVCVSSVYLDPPPPPYKEGTVFSLRNRDQGELCDGILSWR